jgi:hypothetical protein
MSEFKEEQAGEILWKYVEELKHASEPASVNFVAITRTETDELAGVMKTAAQVAQALADDERVELSKESARRRFRERAAVLSREPEATGRRPTQVPTTMSPPGWRSALNWPRLPRLAPALGWGVAGLLAFMLLVPTLRGSRSEPPARLARQQVDRGPSCSVVSRAVVRLARNQVPVDEARTLWRHLVHCDHCFDGYRQAWRAANRAASGHQSSAGERPFSRLLADWVHGLPACTRASVIVRSLAL